MRSLRMWWRRSRGWWLLAAAAAATAVLASIGHAYTGLAAAIVVAVGGAVAAVASERGQRTLSDPASARPTAKDVYVRRVSQIGDPIELGAHPGASLRAGDGRVDQVPPFVRRDQWAEMTTALTGGGLVLVVGDSAAGKTRLAYEAMRDQLPAHTCVKPARPEALTEAITVAKDARPSVLWLDDFERYLRLGGLTPIALAGLLRTGGGNVVVLATMRAHERETFSARYDAALGPAERELARNGREVLHAVTAEIELPRRWSADELASARQLADDPRIADALRSAGKYGLAELIAAGPQLMQDFRDARSTSGPVTNRPADGPYGGPRGAALVQAAIDARLAGYERPIPLALLRDLHGIYLDSWGGAALRPDRWDNALSWATAPLHATSSLLQPAGDDTYLAFDYVVDEVARDPSADGPPDAVWPLLLERAEWADVVPIAWKASFAGQLEHVEPAVTRATAARKYVIAAGLASCLGQGGREAEAIESLEKILGLAETDPVTSASDLLAIREQLAWQIGQKRTGYGAPKRAMEIMRAVVSDSAAIHGADHRSTLDARLTLARQIGGSGDPEQALAIAREVDAVATAAFGAGDETTLDARFEVAAWTGDVAGAAAAAEQFTNLVRQGRQAEPERVDLIADSMWNLASWLSIAGDHARAVQVSAEAIGVAQQAFGANSARVMAARGAHAVVIGEAGDAVAAAALSADLADESAAVLGQSHLITLEARQAAAFWTAAAGDPRAAVERYRALVADLEELLGHDHQLTGQCRAELAELEPSSEVPPGGR